MRPLEARLEASRTFRLTLAGLLAHETTLSGLMARNIRRVAGCWLWVGPRDDDGYGLVTFDGVRTGAHRASYRLHVGPIPEHLEIDHLCRVRCCVRPEHLEAVTSRVNVLRGVGAPAENARRTHCRRGHPLSGDNLKIEPGPRRRCRTCQRAQSRRAAEVLS